VVAVRVYIEGGGTTRREQVGLRQGFADLFTKLLGDRPKPKVIPGGGRDNALKEFECGVRTNPEALCLLLVDSEAAVQKASAPWEHVRTREGDGWSRPDGATDEQLHFMVQTMEAWFLADPEALAAYYGQGFRDGALPRHKDVERVAKADLNEALERATKDSKKKGRYQKSHGFELIGKVDPAKVRRASRHAARFFDVLAAACSPGAGASTKLDLP
jgi:hypothetical protein